MLKHGKQKQTITGLSGFISNPLDADTSGLVDLIRMNNSLSIVTFINNQLMACIDTSGNPFLFYYQKNRYIHIKTTSPATQIIFIDQNEGHLGISCNQNIQVCSLNNGKLLKTLKTDHQNILNLHANHLRSLLLSATSQQCILWNISNYEKFKTLHAKSNKFVSACFMPNGQDLATVFDDKTLCIFSLSSFEIITKFNLTDNMLKCQMVLSNNKLLINTGQIYTIQNGTFSELVLSQTYGGAILQVRPGANNCLFLLTKSSQIICVDANGLVASQVSLPVGKTPLCFDVFSDRLAVVINTSEILIYDIKKLQKVEQVDSYKENQNQSSNINECSAININIRKVGESLIAQPFQASQSEVMKRKPNLSSDLSIQNIPYNTCTLSKLFKQTHQDPLKTLLNSTKLQMFLKQFGQFPEEQRSLAWRSLLDLPLNEEAYRNLVQLGVHDAFKNLAQRYPMSSQSMFLRLQRTLSCLAFYCPLFAEVDYLPELVFPFVKIFRRGEELILFEVVLTLLVHVFQHFFESFPNAPVELLAKFDSHLKKLDPDLYIHMKNLEYSNVKHIWPSFKCFFTDILNKDQFLQFMDYVISNIANNPLFFVHFMAQYIIYFRSIIITMKEPAQLDIFFSKQNGFPLAKLLSQFSVDIAFSQNFPLSHGQYQVFNLYPKYGVEYQQHARQEIQEREDKLQMQRRNIAQLQQLSEQMIQMEEEVKLRSQTLQQAEKDRREMLDYEIEMKAQKNLLVQQEIREKRLIQIQQIEQLMRNTLQQQEELSSQDQDLLARQFQKFSQVSNLQLQNRQEEEALMQLEYQSFQRFNELIQARGQIENNRKIRHEMEFRYKQKEYQDNLQEEQFKTQQQEEKLKQDLHRYKQIVKVSQMKGTNDQIAIEQQQILQQMNDGVKLHQLERDKNLRNIALQEQSLSKSSQQQGNTGNYESLNESLNNRENIGRFEQFRQQLEQQMNQLQQSNTMNHDEAINEIIKSREQDIQTRLSNIRNDIQQESNNYNFSGSEDQIYQTGDFHQQQQQREYSPGQITYSSRATSKGGYR